MASKSGQAILQELLNQGNLLLYRNIEDLIDSIPQIAAEGREDSFTRGTLSNMYTYPAGDPRVYGSDSIGQLIYWTLLQIFQPVTDSNYLTSTRGLILNPNDLTTWTGEFRTEMRETFGRIFDFISRYTDNASAAVNLKSGVIPYSALSLAGTVAESDLASALATKINGKVDDNMMAFLMPTRIFGITDSNLTADGLRGTYLNNTFVTGADLLNSNEGSATISGVGSGGAFGRINNIIIATPASIRRGVCITKFTADVSFTGRNNIQKNYDVFANLLSSPEGTIVKDMSENDVTLKGSYGQDIVFHQFELSSEIGQLTGDDSINCEFKFIIDGNSFNGSPLTKTNSLLNDFFYRIADYNSFNGQLLIDQTVHEHKLSSALQAKIAAATGGTVDLSAYLTKTSAASTYVTQANSLLTFLSKNDATRDYLTKTDATSKYLSKTGATSLYAPLTALTSYVTKTSAAGTYRTIADSYTKAQVDNAIQAATGEVNIANLTDYINQHDTVIRVIGQFSDDETVYQTRYEEVRPLNKVTTVLKEGTTDVYQTTVEFLHLPEIQNSGWIVFGFPSYIGTTTASSLVFTSFVVENIANTSQTSEEVSNFKITQYSTANIVSSASPYVNEEGVEINFYKAEQDQRVGPASRLKSFIIEYKIDATKLDDLYTLLSAIQNRVASLATDVHQLRDERDEIGHLAALQACKVFFLKDSKTNASDFFHAEYNATKSIITSVHLTSPTTMQVSLESDAARNVASTTCVAVALPSTITDATPTLTSLTANITVDGTSMTKYDLFSDITTKTATVSGSDQLIKGSFGFDVRFVSWVFTAHSYTNAKERSIKISFTYTIDDEDIDTLQKYLEKLGKNLVAPNALNGAQLLDQSVEKAALSQSLQSAIDNAGGSVDLTPYLTQTSAASTYRKIADSYTKTEVNTSIQSLQRITRDLHVNAIEPTWTNADDTDGDLYQRVATDTSKLADSDFNNQGADISIPNAQDAKTNVYVRLPFAEDINNYRILVDGIIHWTANAWVSALASTETYQYWLVGNVNIGANNTFQLQKHPGSLIATEYTGELGGQALKQLNNIAVNVSKNRFLGFRAWPWTNDNAEYTKTDHYQIYEQFQNFQVTDVTTELTDSTDSNLKQQIITFEVHPVDTEVSHVTSPTNIVFGIPNSLLKQTTRINGDNYSGIEVTNVTLSDDTDITTGLSTKMLTTSQEVADARLSSLLESFLSFVRVTFSTVTSGAVGVKSIKLKFAHNGKFEIDTLDMLLSRLGTNAYNKLLGGDLIKPGTIPISAVTTAFKAELDKIGTGGGESVDTYLAALQATKVFFADSTIITAGNAQIAYDNTTSQSFTTTSVNATTLGVSLQSTSTGATSTIAMPTFMVLALPTVLAGNSIALTSLTALGLNVNGATQLNYNLFPDIRSKTAIAFTAAGTVKGSYGFDVKFFIWSIGGLGYTNAGNLNVACGFNYTRHANDLDTLQKYLDFLGGKVSEKNVIPGRQIISLSGDKVETGTLPETALTTAAQAKLNATGSGGALTDGSVDTPQLADGAVTNPKVADGTLGIAKFAPGTRIALRGDKGDDGRNGTDGQDGAPGANGRDGEDGVGVPAGGNKGDVLAKKTGADNDTEWITPAAGGGGTEQQGLESIYRAKGQPPTYGDWNDPNDRFLVNSGGNTGDTAFYGYYPFGARAIIRFTFPTPANGRVNYHKDYKVVVQTKFGYYMIVRLSLGRGLQSEEQPILLGDRITSTYQGAAGTADAFTDPDSGVNNTNFSYPPYASFEILKIGNSQGTYPVEMRAFGTLVVQRSRGLEAAYFLNVVWNQIIFDQNNISHPNGHFNVEVFDEFSSNFLADGTQTIEDPANQRHSIAIFSNQAASGSAASGGFINGNTTPIYSNTANPAFEAQSEIYSNYHYLLRLLTNERTFPHGTTTVSDTNPQRINYRWRNHMTLIPQSSELVNSGTGQFVSIDPAGIKTLMGLATTTGNDFFDLYHHEEFTRDRVTFPPAKKIFIGKLDDFGASFQTIDRKTAVSTKRADHMGRADGTVLHNCDYYAMIDIKIPTNFEGIIHPYRMNMYIQYSFRRTLSSAITITAKYGIVWDASRSGSKNTWVARTSPLEVEIAHADRNKSKPMLVHTLYEARAATVSNNIIEASSFNYPYWNEHTSEEKVTPLLILIAELDGISGAATPFVYPEDRIMDGIWLETADRILAPIDIRMIPISDLEDTLLLIPEALNGNGGSTGVTVGNDATGNSNPAYRKMNLISNKVVST